MAIDPELRQEMFTLATVPLCPAGMQMAEVFLSACGQAVEVVDREDRRAHFLARWDDVVNHATSCPVCNEL